MAGDRDGDGARGGASAFVDAAVGLVVTALLLAGLARPGFPLLRDWVATPSPPLSDAALGLGESAARAVPQDVAMVWATRALDAVGVPVWPLTGLLTAVFCVWLATATGALVRRVIPAARAGGAAGMLVRLPAVVGAVWNPFVVERLLQGHWSLLAGVAAVVTMPLVLARARPRIATACLAVVVAGLTPTGWVLAVGAAAASLACAPRGRRARSLGVVGVVAVVTALPWVLATLLAGSSPGGAGGAGGIGGAGGTGVEAFAARAEMGIGTLGSVVALGGIWNSAAVPPSRETWWAVVALVLMLVVWAVAAPGLWRARRDPIVRATVPLALGTWLLVALAATGPGLVLLDAIVAAVPGAGLLRDTQKFVALALPATVLALGFSTHAVGSRRPADSEKQAPWRMGTVGAALAITAVALSSVPDAPATLWGALRPVTYGPGWAEVNEIIAAQPGDVLVLPAGSFRSTPLWAGGAPVLDPAPRLLRARVLVPGELVVGSQGRSHDDDHIVAGEGSRARAATAALLNGEDPQVLADLGVRWVLDERTSAGPRGESETTLTTATPTPTQTTTTTTSTTTTTTTRFADAEILLYEISRGDAGNPPGETAPAVVASDSDAELASASTSARSVVLAAHAAWMLAGILAAGCAVRRRSSVALRR